MTNSFVLRQRGATLIVSLVILAVITILGVASIRSSNMELRMAASARDRAVAFQRAEAALARIENSLSTTPPPYDVRNFISACTTNCFKASCPNGLCFAGDFDGATSKTQCKQGQREFWKEDLTWKAAPKLEVAKSSTHVGDVEDVRYLIEFLCYVPRTDQQITSAEKDGESDVPLFRITVQATGESARSTVMLQSTYKVSQ